MLLFCRDCQKLLQCYIEAVTDESEAETYVEEFKNASLVDYYSYYECPTGIHTKYLLIDFNSAHDFFTDNLYHTACVYHVPCYWLNFIL